MCREMVAMPMPAIPACLIISLLDVSIAMRAQAGAPNDRGAIALLERDRDPWIERTETGDHVRRDVFAVETNPSLTWPCATPFKASSADIVPTRRRRDGHN